MRALALGFSNSADKTLRRKIGSGVSLVPDRSGKPPDRCEPCRTDDDILTDIGLTQSAVLSPVYGSRAERTQDDDGPAS